MKPTGIKPLLAALPLLLLSLLLVFQPLEDIFFSYRQSPLDPAGLLGFSSGLVFLAVALIPPLTGIILLSGIFRRWSWWQKSMLVAAAGVLLVAAIKPTVISTTQLISTWAFACLYLLDILRFIVGQFDGKYKWLKGILYLLFLATLLLAAAEFVLRQRFAETNALSKFSPPNRDLTFRPDADSYTYECAEFTQHFTTNSQHIFDKEVPAIKDTNEVRILVFGDSFTQGIGAVDEDTRLSDKTPPEHSWPLQLERLLNEEDNVNYRVINAGIAASDVVYMYRLAQELVHLYQPDIVLLALNRSDVGDIAVRGGDERFINGEAVYHQPDFDTTLYQRFFLYRFYLHQIRGVDMTTFAKPENKRSTDEQTIQIISQKILDFQAYSLEQDFDFKVVFHPIQSEIENGQLSLLPVLQQVEQEVYCIDLLTIMQKHNITPESAYYLYWPLDYHHNASGYHQMAQSIYKVLHPWANLVSHP